jgi:hypothetical protein
LIEQPAEGQTYSLFGNDRNTDGFYRAVAETVDRALTVLPRSDVLLEMLRSAGTSKRRLDRISAGKDNRLMQWILEDARDTLSPYTRAVSGHLASLPIARRFDRVMGMREDQYHLAMLEIELMNRRHRGAFLEARTRLAMLPHCLRDWNTDCRAEPDDVDEVCQGCSGECWNNAITALLGSSGIQPYIWMTADLPKLMRAILRRDGSLGLLGIACIPELVRGMRSCERHGVPVVGLPLNGNRCRRWMGAFHPNSVNLGRLAALVGARVQ